MALRSSADCSTPWRATTPGLLITVDEVHRGARDDLRDLAATVQHLIREDRDIALAMAGLPSAASDLLNDEILHASCAAPPASSWPTFRLAAVRDALHTDHPEGAAPITDEALDEAADATGGYPFMIQLVGYHIWRLASGETIDAAAVRAGVAAARKRLGLHRPRDRPRRPVRHRPHLPPRHGTRPRRVLDRRDRPPTRGPPLTTPPSTAPASSPRG